MIRYVVLNPVRSGLVGDPGEWEWSNYRSTCGMRAPESWLEINWTLSQFDAFNRASAHARYAQFVADARGAAYRPSDLLVGQIYLGSASFQKRMQELIGAKPRSREHPRPQTELVRPEFDRIAAAVSDVFGVEEARLIAQGGEQGRKALAILSWQEGGLSLAAIATRMNVSGQAVSKMVSAATRQEQVSDEFRRKLRDARQRIG